MNLRRHVTIIGAAAIGAASILGSNIVHADTASSSAPGRIMYRTFNKSETRFASEGLTYLCDPGYPYLVLDAVPDNSSKAFRRATYNTGDDKPLNFFEHVIPLLSENGDFRDAHILVEIKDTKLTSGHGSVTIQCASTLEAAHQK
ncbi:hypothetical protein LQL77_32240 [Rhodococcus cerastii]|nr:hypothetical protein [Rhodococcus cerastii]